MRRWNEDPHTKRAQRENYEARSVYKLKEIDDREHLFRGTQTVVDLGASPGSWTQYALEKISKEKGQVFAVDLAPLNVSDPRITFLQQSIDAVDLGNFLPSEKVDLVLSDMAPKTSGIHDRDVYLSFELASQALTIAKGHLKGSGKFVVKLFMGESFEEFHQMMKQTFKTVRLLRPETTRKHSREIYFVGKDLRNVPAAAPTA